MMIKAYWNGNGEEQAKYNEMTKAEENGEFEFTKAAYADFRRYYRYYNDGDIPGWARSYHAGYRIFDWQTGWWKMNEAGEQELERRATECIRKEYKRFMKTRKVA